MLKILEPFWNRALLGCSQAPLKKGSRIFQFPKNGIHCTDLHWMNHLTSLRNNFNACNMFHQRRQESKLDVLFSHQKSPRCSLGSDARVSGHRIFSLSPGTIVIPKAATYQYGYKKPPECIPNKMASPPCHIYIRHANLKESC
jgi:hypothetical protein